MSDLGNPAIGVDGTQGTDVGLIVMTRVQAAETGSLTSLQGWVQAADASYADLIFMVYGDSAGHPTTVLAQTAQFHSAPDGSMGQRTSGLISPLAITNGTWYWIGCQVKHDSTYVSLSNTAGQTGYRHYGGTFGTLPDLSALGSTDTDRRYAFSGTIAAAAATLSTLDASAVVGGTGYSGTTANMAAITSLTNATITGTSANAFTYSMNAWQHGVAYLRPTGSPTFTASDGTLSDTLASPLGPMAGYTAVTVASILRNQWTIGQDTNIVNTDVLCLPTAMGTVNPDTSLTDAVFGTYTMWRWEAATGIMYTSQLTVADSGITIGANTLNSSAFFILYA